ncbi:restriction endonuclease subunit S [Ideonella azotifigens]|uniref:Restriction endonuclease subunit S n=1 Tax=Ideonella azotifigens TaxID=513160 RepID=A0ABP3V2W9_9BURK|nr:restriction endonuclease subunit S [Ideonella azotifigens]MCD2340191.1 restriction endonuclease subunit S [Ideonella azotifigens]
MTALASDNLQLLADAPGGVGALRRLILDLAVSGRLVAQDPADDSVEVLISQVVSRKASVGGSRKEKLKARAAVAPSKNTLPPGWVQMRLGDLTTKLGAGSTPLGGKQVYVAEGVMFLRSQNVWNDGLRLGDVARIPTSIHREMAGTHVFSGDLLFNITGASIGRCAAVPSHFDGGNVSQHVVIVRPALLELQAYLHKVLISDLVQDAVMAEQVGVSREGLSVAKLSEFAIPLPPLGEQHRIVAKVDELMALCDRLDSRQQDAEAAHARLVQVLLDSLTQARDADEFQACWRRLAGQFPLLFTTETSVESLRRTSIQLAVRGLLCETGPSDAHATALINSIAASRAQAWRAGLAPKPKPFSQVDGEEMPHRLPLGWSWVRLGQLGVASTGSTPVTTQTDAFDGPTPFIGPGQITPGGVISSGEKSLSDTGLASSTVARPGDLLMVCIGGSIGKCAIADRVLAFNQQINSLSVFEASPHFVFLVMCSPEFQQAVLGAATGSATPIINRSKWEDIPVPLPPLATQHRIVAKVTELLALCDQLKASIAAARAKHVQLAEALVAQAVAG